MSKRKIKSIITCENPECQKKLDFYSYRGGPIADTPKDRIHYVYAGDLPKGWVICPNCGHFTYSAFFLDEVEDFYSE